MKISGGHILWWMVLLGVSCYSMLVAIAGLINDWPEWWVGLVCAVLNWIMLAVQIAAAVDPEWRRKP